MRIMMDINKIPCHEDLLKLKKHLSSKGLVTVLDILDEYKKIQNVIFKDELSNLYKRLDNEEMKKNILHKSIQSWFNDIISLYDQNVVEKISIEHFLVGIAILDKYFKDEFLKNKLYDQVSKLIEEENPLLKFLNFKTSNEFDEVKSIQSNKKIFKENQRTLDRLEEIKRYLKLKTIEDSLIISVELSSKILSEMKQNRKIVVKEKSGILYELKITGP
jgi:hypothetical protein